MPVFLGALEDIRTLNSSMLKELEMCSSPKAALGLISRYAPLFKVSRNACESSYYSRLVYDSSVSQLGIREQWYCMVVGGVTDLHAVRVEA